MVEWYCRICRCRTTGAAAHVTQLSEFLWLPSPSKNYNQTSENPRTTTFCTQFCTQKVCVQILKVFCTQHTSTQKGKSRMAQHCTIASTADMETRKYLLHGVIVQRHCCKVAISKMQLHSSIAYTKSPFFFLLAYLVEMHCN